MVRFQETPDANSLKVVLPQPIAEDPVVIEDEDDAQGDPLAEELMMIPGVTDLYYMQEFLTINKDATTEWDDIRPKIEQIVDEYAQPGF
jgi:hypothetical protein